MSTHPTVAPDSASAARPMVPENGLSSAVWETLFYQLAEILMGQLHGGEHLYLQLTGEDSQFLRFNRSRVRQTGQVRDGQIRLTLMGQGRTCDRTVPFTGHKANDLPRLETALRSARAELPQLPEDPYLILPRGSATSREEYPGQLLTSDELPETLLAPLTGTDSAGLYAGGRSIRAYADSAGQFHWFDTETYTLDYSLFTEDGRAAKGILAGNHWQTPGYQAQLEQSRQFLALMERPAKTLPRGRYRTYLAPAAVADLIRILSWGGISEAALRRSGGALRALQQGEKTLSPKIHLQENFQQGLVPRFNRWGEVAAPQLSLIQAGQLVNTLVSSRTAREYQIPSNYAAPGESLRSPQLAAGNLAEADMLKTLGTGLYLSNLHYLNWSDRPSGRITGMTRYACFWVEQGEIVAPIENLRFDESLYHFWGEGLVGLTQQVTCVPEVGSYGFRDLGGTWVPGMLVNDFTYTL